MHALAALLEEQDRAEARELYMGNMLWMIAKASNRDITIKPLSDIMHEAKVQDNRTGREIAEDVVAMLSE